MKTEFEAKFPKINKDEIRQKLKELGAELVFPERKFTRYTFDNPQLLKKKSWIRLRDEGDKITMTLKKIQNKDSISGMKELEFEISEIETAKSMLEELGFIHRGYEENLREEWRVGKVLFDIDTWPLIDPYLEIEAPSAKEVELWFKKLGLDYSKAMFGAVVILYKEIYGIDILKMKQLTFDH